MPAVSVIEGNYRYVSGSGLSGRKFEVLLSTEDGQRRNLLEENPEVAERLREKAKSVLAQKSKYESDVIELDSMQLDQLRALGYQLP